MAIMGSPIFFLVCLIPLYGILAAPNVIRPSFIEQTIVLPATKSKCEVLDDIINGNYSNGNLGSRIDYDGEMVVRVLTTEAHTEDICAMMYNATQAFCRLLNEKQSMIRLKQVKSEFKSRFGITNELCEDLKNNERLPSFAESARHDDAKKTASLIFCQLRLKIIDEKKPLCSYFASSNSQRPSNSQVSDSFSQSRGKRSDTNEDATDEQKIAINESANDSSKNESAVTDNKNEDGIDEPTLAPHEVKVETTKLPETDEDGSETAVRPSAESPTNDSTSTPNSPPVNHDVTTSTEATSTVVNIEGNDEHGTNGIDEDDPTFGPRIGAPPGPKPDGWQKRLDGNENGDDYNDDTQDHEDPSTHDGFHGKTSRKHGENIPANDGSREATSTTNRENLPTNDGLQGTSTMVPPTNAAGTLLGNYTTHSIILGLLLAQANFYMIFNSIL